MILFVLIHLGDYSTLRHVYNRSTTKYFISDLQTQVLKQDWTLKLEDSGLVELRHFLCSHVRVTHVNSASNQNTATSTIFKKQENEKRREYLRRVLDIKHGTFTPLVFGTNGRMGAECTLSLKTLAELLARKNGKPYSVVIAWLRTRLSFEILRSINLSVRGS